MSVDSHRFILDLERKGKDPLSIIKLILGDSKLLKAYKSIHPDFDEVSVLRWLMNHRDRSLIPFLKSVVEHEPNAGLKVLAVDALVSMKDMSLIPYLESCYSRFDYAEFLIAIEEAIIELSKEDPNYGLNLHRPF